MKFKNKKSVFDGIKFDSQLELNIYRLFKMLKIKFTVHEDTFTLLKGYTIEDFSLKKKYLYKAKVRPMTYTPDFTLYAPNGIIIFLDAKGMATESFKLKWKLFRHQLKSNERAFVIKSVADADTILNLFHIPKNVKQMKIDLKL